MILIIPALLYIFALTFIYGSVAVISLDKLLAPPNKHNAPLSIVNIIGIVVLAVMTGYLSLFMKIGMVANIVMSVTAIVLYLVNRTEINHLAERYLSGVRTANRFAIVIFLLLCVLVLIETADQPKVGDSGLYHIQTIKWIERFGVVPGLGNLHGMYALNSMWYPLSALFGFSFFGVESLHIVNGALFIFAGGFFLGGVTDILTGSNSLVSLIKAAAIPFSLFVYKSQIGSPATDLPVALLLWIVFILCLENVDHVHNLRSNATNVIVIAIAFYVLTIKLSALPIAILCLYLFYRQYKQRKWLDLCVQIGVGLIILVPWIARNIILSGYLAYPFPYIDVFKFDWKLSYQYVIEEKLSNHGWARLPGPQWKDSLNMSPLEWIPKWLGWLPYLYKVTIVATFCILLIYLGLIISRILRRSAVKTNARDILYLVACIGVVYWFTNAPDPRFGFGFIFIALVIPIALLIQPFMVRLRVALRPCVLPILILYILYHGYLSIQLVPKDKNFLFWPRPYPTEELQSKLVDHIVVYSPIKTDQCWDAPLPCTPILNDQLRPRGDSVAAGFRIIRTEPTR
jgi:hypothetical protein